MHGAVTAGPGRRSYRAWGDGSRCSSTSWTRTLPLASERQSLIISAESPPGLSLTAARRAAHSLATLGRARVLYVAGTDGDDTAGDRNYLVLAKPNVIINDIRLRGLGVAGSDAAGRKSPHNHAQTVRTLKRSLQNAAAGARLIQAEGLDSKSAADVAATLAAALEDLHRLQRRLDRLV